MHRYHAVRDIVWLQAEPERRSVRVRALDPVGALDVALIFSQDQDLSELCTDIREIAREQQRWIRIASAYPWSEAVPRACGLRNSEWIRILKPDYDRCLRPDRGSSPQDD